MDRRDPGLLGTLFSFGSPLLAGFLAAYECWMRFDESDPFSPASSAAVSWPPPPYLAPLAGVLLGWLALSLVLHVIAWIMNGKGTFLDTLGALGRMAGVLAVIEGVRLGSVLSGLNEWAALAWFSAGSAFALGWTGRAWGKIHLLSSKETLAVTVIFFYAPTLVLAGWVIYPSLKYLL